MTYEASSIANFSSADHDDDIYRARSPLKGTWQICPSEISTPAIRARPSCDKSCRRHGRRPHESARKLRRKTLLPAATINTPPLPLHRIMHNDHPLSHFHHSFSLMLAPTWSSWAREKNFRWSASAWYSSTGSTSSASGRTNPCLRLHLHRLIPMIDRTDDPDTSPRPRGCPSMSPRSSCRNSAALPTSSPYPMAHPGSAAPQIRSWHETLLPDVIPDQDVHPAGRGLGI